MLILDATNKSLEAVLDAAAATTNPDFVTSYADITTTTFVPGAQDGALNGTTPVTIGSSPASSTQRQIKTVNIQNRDTIDHTITINYIDGASTRQILKWNLLVGDSLIYTDQRGWIVYNSNGAQRSQSIVISPSGFLPSLFNAANITTVLSLTSGTSYALWLGTANKVSSSVSVRYRVTTAAATITYAEIGIFKGNVNLGGNPTLTRLGYADVSGIVNSTGVFTTNVTLSTPTAIGDNLWAVFGDSAVTTWVVRGGLADDIQSGTFANISGRPSTITSPTAWTIAGNTDVVPWFKGFVN